MKRLFWLKLGLESLFLEGFRRAFLNFLEDLRKLVLIRIPHLKGDLRDGQLLFY